MLCSKIDFISPLITLNYKGELRHSSIVSAILSIIVIIVVIAFGVIYMSEFINHKNPSAFYFNRFTDDAGIFPVNSSSMFSFLQFYGGNNKEKKIDFDIFTIIGINKTSAAYLANHDLEELDHWIYGYCNNDSDTEGIKELITYENFTHYACIRKFFREKDKRYYDVNEVGFEWPIILHGQSRRDATFYGIVIEKCRNNTLKDIRDGTKCKSNEEIEDYIYDSFFNYHIIDHYTDVLNYEKPIISYFYSITGGFYKDTFTVNNLNFNPLIVKTHHGFFFDKITESYSYVFEQNDIGTNNKENTDTEVLLTFYFWMQNRLQYFERNYKKLTNVLPNIGGIYSTIITVVKVINYLISYYVILLDTEKLGVNLDIKDQEIINNSELNKIKKTFKEITIKNDEQNKKLEEQSENNPILHQNKNSNISFVRNLNNFSNIDGQINKNKNTQSNEKDIKKNNYFESSETIKGKNNKEKNSFLDLRQKDKDKGKSSKEFTFCKYLSFIISGFNNNPKMKQYIDFRSKIISEENIIENHINISNLLKISKIEK